MLQTPTRQTGKLKSYLEFLSPSVMYNIIHASFAGLKGGLVPVRLPLGPTGDDRELYLLTWLQMPVMLKLPTSEYGTVVL